MGKLFPKRLFSALLSVMILCTSFTVPTMEAFTIFPNDANYKEVDKVLDLYKMMQEKQTFNGVLHLDRCITTEFLKTGMKEFRKLHNDTVYGAEVNTRGYGKILPHLKPMIFNTNKLTGERTYPDDLRTAIIFRVENGVIVRAQHEACDLASFEEVWLGTNNALTPMSPEDKKIMNTTVNYPSREQIASMWVKYGLNKNNKDIYAQNPSATAPYDAGKLSDAAQTEALNTLNFMRYIAGLDYNVTLDDSYTKMAQDASLVMAVNNEMTHTPAKPADMDDALYNSGAKGASNSNIAKGLDKLPSAIIEGWMKDSDDSNYAAAGHRRWILNPQMAKTGFGLVNDYSAMYAMDRQNSSASAEGVMWPAQNMPIEYFSNLHVWSISFDTKLPFRAADTYVVLKRLSDNKTWTMDAVGHSSDGYAGLNTGGYGQKNCLLFRPYDININKNEVYCVTVKNKLEVYAQSFVTFFSLFNTNAKITSDSELVPKTTLAEFDITTVPKTDHTLGKYPNPIPAPTPDPVLTPIDPQDPIITPTPTANPDPIITPKPDKTEKPDATPKPTTTPKPTKTPKPTTTPKPTKTPNPDETLKPSETKKPSGNYLDGASDWATSEIKLAKEKKLTFDEVLGDYQQNITRAEFCKLAVNFYKAMGGEIPEVGASPFGDTSDSDVLIANKLGIVNGTSDTTFEPNAEITREQISAMMMRAIKKFDTPKVRNDLTRFDDYNQISSYAVESLAYLNQVGIMKGMSDTEIAPLENTTREQAILIAYRTLNSFEFKANLVEGTYKIMTATNAANFISINSGSHDDGAKAITWVNSDVDDQKFSIEQVGSKYCIKAVHSGKALTIYGDEGNGTEIAQQTYDGSVSQLFDIVDAGDGYMNFVSSQGYCVSVSAGSPDMGTSIILWEKTGNPSQKFRLVKPN